MYKRTHVSESIQREQRNQNLNKQNRYPVDMQCI